MEWLDRKYTILVSFLAIAAFGTLFGHSQSPAQIMTFAGVTMFFLSLGSTAIYTYTPELHPTEIRTTAMGIASAWERVGAARMLLVFGHSFATLGKSLLFLCIDHVLIVSAAVVFFGPSTRGRPRNETYLGPLRNTHEIDLQSRKDLPMEKIGGEQLWAFRASIRNRRVNSKGQRRGDFNCYPADF